MMTKEQFLKMACIMFDNAATARCGKDDMDCSLCIVSRHTDDMWSPCQHLKAFFREGSFAYYTIVMAAVAVDVSDSYDLMYSARGTADCANSCAGCAIENGKDELLCKMVSYYFSHKQPTPISDLLEKVVSEIKSRGVL